MANPLKPRGGSPEDLQNVREAAQVLKEIAIVALGAVGAYSHMSGGDEDAAAALASTLRESITRMGWLADFAAHKLGYGAVKGDAAAWMLPPVYHAIAQAGERPVHALPSGRE